MLPHRILIARDNDGAFWLQHFAEDRPRWMDRSPVCGGRWGGDGVPVPQDVIDYAGLEELLKPGRCIELAVVAEHLPAPLADLEKGDRVTVGFVDRDQCGEVVRETEMVVCRPPWQDAEGYGQWWVGVVDPAVHPAGAVEYVRPLSQVRRMRTPAKVE